MSNIDNSKFNPMYRAPIMRIIEYRSGNNSSVRRACLQIRNVTERLNRNVKWGKEMDMNRIMHIGKLKCIDLYLL